MTRNDVLRHQRILCNWRQQDVADQVGVSLVTMQRWERGLQQPSAYYRVKLCALFGASAQELGLLTACVESDTEQAEDTEQAGTLPAKMESALWTVPYARNPYFTGREELLEQLSQQFSPKVPGQPGQIQRAALTQSLAIKGLGGVGKTQLAVEYAYRSHEQGRYTHTIWINAANEEALLGSFVALSDLVPDAISSQEKDQHKRVKALIRWLEQCSQPWLLIFDNADDLSLIPSYLPARGNGHILFTTRVSAVGSLASSVEVDCMSLMEGIHLLLRRAQRQASASASEIDEATNIVIALAQFPLALDQAGAYIEETGCSLSEYFQIYQRHRFALLARRGQQISSYPESVATTWSLSFQQIEQNSPAAAELLRLFAFLAPDHIPGELLSEGAPYWTPVLQQAAADPLTFNQMIELLLAFSLVKRLSENHLFSIHRLVQIVQMERLDLQERHQWAERLTRAVHAVFPRNPEDEIALWPQCQRYLEQVQVCDVLIQEQGLLLPEAAELLERAGTYLRERALYTLAETLYQRALALQEQRVGPEHLDMARVLYHLATLFYRQGQQAQAEALYLRALRIRERHLGPEHPDVATTLTGLALIYTEQGKHAQAEPLYVRALNIQERQLGTEHPELAATLSGLAFFSFIRGQYEYAESLYLQALRIQERQLGETHLDVATTLTGLAYIYGQQGRYQEEEHLYQRALRIQERQLGPGHLRVAETLTGLANLYRELGKYPEAEEIYRRALNQEQLLGPEHVELARPLLGLALLSYKQGKLAQAENLHQRVLRILERLLGTEHYLMAFSLVGLADIARDQGQHEQAESLYLRALRIREQQLGPEHPNVVAALQGLAQLFARQGKDEQAERFYQRALHICEQRLGSTSHETAEVLYDFAHFRQVQGHLQEAASLYQRALMIREHALGADSLVTVATRERRQEILVALSQMEETVEGKGKR